MTPDLIAEKKTSDTFTHTALLFTSLPPQFPSWVPPTVGGGHTKPPLQELCSPSASPPPTVHCAPCTVHFITSSVHCTLYTVQISPPPPGSPREMCLSPSLLAVVDCTSVHWTNCTGLCCSTLTVLCCTAVHWTHCTVLCCTNLYLPVLHFSVHFTVFLILCPGVTDVAE